ncbi:MAG: hypothetical protein RJA07_488 [Bacteroidota bacterium]|jgi:hypothetical protein
MTDSSSLVIKNAVVLLNEIQSDKSISNHKQIKQRGAFLYFYIDHNKVRHEFEVELLEDLYMFLKSEWKNQEGKLYDCACVVRGVTTNSIVFFEEVNAKSLNEVYKKTYVHYFSNEGNPACNAIDRFYEKPNQIKLSLREFSKFDEQSKTKDKLFL